MKRRRKVKVFQDRASEWRFLLVAANGRVLDGSTEGYKRRGYCIERAKACAKREGAVLVVMEPDKGWRSRNS